ncbi:hypothetical protein F8M41_021100 [Gigaspora margarita]|uniref:Uncharacterized protein n=1 Tax=Gigaspora margarita TaxID=4874 RepID=A0A8H4AHE0_GIGMA|nr:hypothetical protein F8M41_021100 [Gigaspora margarita]
MNIYSEFDVLKSGESLLEINDCSEIEEKVPEEVVVIPLKDCIDMHKKKEYKSAWECFKQNAELNDPYFEEADDENNYSEAQCKYVVLLIVDLSKETDETAKGKLRKEILRYFELATNNPKVETLMQCIIWEIFI